MKRAGAGSRKFGVKLCGALLIIAAAAPRLAAQSSLFYLEAQAVGGASSAEKKFIFFSMERAEVMQKPGLGVDYVQRFSGASGDWGLLAVQARVVYNAAGNPDLETQIYNAYLRLKLGGTYLWAGHNKPRFGLSTVLDNHGSLLQPLSMMGFGFDRDWGIGLDHDFAGGTAGLSLTTGSGMGLKTSGTTAATGGMGGTAGTPEKTASYFLAGRISKNLLDQDNFSAGFSAAVGRIFDVVGYQTLSDSPMPVFLAGADLSWRKGSWEHNFEVMAGRREGLGTLAVFWRTGVSLLDEARLKLEAQPIYMTMQGISRFQLMAGATYLAHPDWTLRTMISYDSRFKDVKILFQVYFYKSIRL
jgi:hypothetical protein